MLSCPTCGREFGADAVETTCPEDGTPLQADSTLVSAAPTDPMLGRVLDDKYRLDERLGEGGMGTVYRATHLLIERPVAVKVLNSRLVLEESARERFRREARAAGRLRHTNAVAVTDFGETSDGLVYIVMELLEGRSLRDVLLSEAPLEAARAVSLMLQTSAAVAAAHEAGIIHRDLKPGNIFVVQRPHAPHLIKVLDFGIAKLATDATDGGQAVTLTGAGVMIGTPRYMSPEQCDGTPLTPASDVYSLGVILYEMLAGQPPFSGATPLAVALKHSSELPRPPREIVATIPPALESFVLHTLGKKSAERPQDAGEFRRSLYQIAERLGLEHADGFSAPTIETLRDAGTETPSGRLVIDIERLRQTRAASMSAPVTQDGAPPADTAEEEALQTGRKPAPTGVTDALAAASTGSAAQSVSSGAHAEASGSSRLRIPLRSRGEGRTTSWGAYFKQSPALWGALAVGLLLFGVAIFAWRSAQKSEVVSGGDSTTDGEAFGRTLSDADVTPRTSPVNSEPRSAVEFYERGGYYFSSRNYDGAIEDLRRAVELQPDFADAHNRLGRVLMRKGQFGAATESFREAITKKDGAFPAASYNLGFALKEQGRNDEALRAFDEAIKARDGKYSDAHFQIGIIHLKNGRDGEAAEAMRRAVEQNKNPDPDAHHSLGVALARRKDYEGAERAFRTAIEQRGGDFADAHFNLALVYENTNRPGDAVKEFEIYLQQQPRGESRRLAENSIKELRRRIEREATNAN